MECHNSKIKIALMLGGTVLFALATLFVVVLREDPTTGVSGITYPPSFLGVIGWLFIAFCLAGSAALTYMLFQSGVQVAISNQGIEDRRTKMGVIEWDDIIGVASKQIRMTPGGKIAQFLSVFVKDREKYFSRIQPSRWLKIPRKSHPGPGEIEIPFVGLTPSCDNVIEYLQQHYPHKILHADTSLPPN